MTQKQREKLIFCAGMLSGMQWCIDSNAIADALQSVQEDIDTLLEEDTNGSQAD